jgi:hypothetical protein
MGEHLKSIRCSWCEAVVWYFNIEDPSCQCGWDADEDFKDRLRDRCDEQGRDFDELFEEFDGDLEVMDSYLWAMSKDD